MLKEVEKDNQTQTIFYRFGIDITDMNAKDAEELAEELQEFENFVLARRKSIKKLGSTSN